MRLEEEEEEDGVLMWIKHGGRTNLDFVVDVNRSVTPCK